jgi:UDP-N-acetylglucosamine acyltransferase
MLMLSEPPVIHPTAIVDPAAILGAGVSVGPYAVIESDVVIGDRTRILAHAVILSGTVLGAGCEVHSGAVIGGSAQIRGHGGRGGSIAIGDRTIIREHATVHRASLAGARTVVGADCLLLAGSHVAHDCTLEDGVTLANSTLLAGNVHIGRGAFISGHVVVHQHVRVGALSIVGGRAEVGKDVPPYLLVIGRSLIRGINVVGLRRAGISPTERQTVRRMYGVLYRSGLAVSRARAEIATLPRTPVVQEMLEFIDGSQRGLCRGGVRGRQQRPRRRSRQDGRSASH